MKELCDLHTRMFGKYVMQDILVTSNPVQKYKKIIFCLLINQAKSVGCATYLVTDDTNRIRVARTGGQVVTSDLIQVVFSAIKDCPLTSVAT